MGEHKPHENTLYEFRDGIGFVTINRPKAMNALNADTFDELECLFTKIRERDEVKAAIITGGGPKAFVAGADIVELAELSPLDAQLCSGVGQRVMDLIENCGKPVIAAINGFALGGGLELALACHIRLAADTARVGLPEVTLGLIPGYGGTQRLARLCGTGRALEMILTGDMVDAATAERHGIVNRVVPTLDLMKEAEALARKIMTRGPVATRLATEAVLAGSGLTLAEGQRLERELFGLCFSSDDMKEGTQAFLEKRKPEFKGS